MFDNEHLAIASVPLQTWDKVYDENEALENGTIFPDLKKPFFITVEDSVQKQKEDGPQEGQQDARQPGAELLLQIQKVSFVVDDVRLYMDTHPRDREGLALLKTMLGKRKALLKEFALQCYPLTMDCMADIYENAPDSDCYCWQEGPSPWEGGCV